MEQEKNILEKIIEQETGKKTVYYEPRYGNNLLISHYPNKNMESIS